MNKDGTLAIEFILFAQIPHTIRTLLGRAGHD
jgi:hypothetical protein